MANKSDHSDSNAFAEIQFDWLRFAPARFRFFSEYATTEKLFLANVTHILHRKISRHDTVRIDVSDPKQIRVFTDILRWTIDSRDGTFCLEKPNETFDWFDEGIFENFGPPLYGLPEEFFTNINLAGQSLIPAADLLVELSSQFWTEMQYRFHCAIVAGDAQLYARKESILRPFTFVSPDQYLSLKIQLPEQEDNLTFGETNALGPRGEKIWSLYVRPVVRQRSKKNQEKQEVLRWIVTTMEETKDRRLLKAEFLIEARKKWPELSGRVFESLWSHAKSVVPETRYGTAGARSKSIRRTLNKS
jgi:hypothetical protein